MGKGLVSKITNLNIRNASAIDYSNAAEDTVKWGLSPLGLVGVVTASLIFIVIAALVYLIKKEIARSDSLGYRLFVKPREEKLYDTAEYSQIGILSDFALSGKDITSLPVNGIENIHKYELFMEPKKRNNDENKKEIDVAYSALQGLLTAKRTYEKDPSFDIEAAAKKFRTELRLDWPIKRPSVLK